MRCKCDIGSKAALWSLAVLGLVPGITAFAESSAGRLQREFSSPPDSAKPRVWWHWMDGNVTEEGIRLDLDWMRRVGIGGVQIFDVSLGARSVVPKPVVFMSQRWSNAFRYALTVAHERGLEVGIGGSPGFSESGGPWVRPEDAMKKLVWSEVRVRGGAPIAVRLPQPTDTVGPFRGVAVDRSNAVFGRAPPEPIPNLYRDVAVVAYRVPPGDRTMAELSPSVISNVGPITTPPVLWDDNFNTDVTLAVREQGGTPAWIQMDFVKDRTIHSMMLALRSATFLSAFVDPPPAIAVLQSSQDGAAFQTIATLYGSTDLEQTVTFAPARARYFRVLLPTLPMEKINPTVSALVGRAPTEQRIAELALYTTPRINHFEQKAGFFGWMLHVVPGLDRPQTPHVSPEETISQGEVLDLSSHVRADGTLDWTPPAGEWAVLRFGYSLLGITNHPAAAEASGLEVDKLNPVAVRAYVDGYLGQYESSVGPQVVRPDNLHSMVMDSYEVGVQNWTDQLPKEFARRRGYDLRRWLPALTGRIIGNAEDSDRFLWDFRRTLGELLSESHSGGIAEVLHRRGMVYYAEAHEVGRAFIGDGMDVKRYADIPMAAMWVGDFPASQTQYDADIRESASVAHIYGKGLVAVESLSTAGSPETAYAFDPAALKPTADRELADGANLFVVHTSVHQPLTDVGPGVTLGPFGQWFTRHETWAEQATPWVNYLARSSYLLQQGSFAADVLYYYGQDTNITALFAKDAPPVPEGYAFDFANSDALSRLQVSHGLLTTASGMRYRILALDSRTRVMSFDVLQQIARLVADGATVIGDKPLQTPSLADDPRTFHALADEVWGAEGAGKHRYKRGLVIGSRSLAAAMSGLQLPPDFSFAKPAPDSTVWFVHRRLPQGDIYFINNRQDRAERIEGRFRVSGKVPELWHAETGSSEPISYRQEGGQTVVPLSLDPYDAVFVLFHKQARQPRLALPSTDRVQLGSVDGPWEVHFQTGRGAPEQAVFASLKSWTRDSDPGIKYFSGTARYETSLHVPDAWLRTTQRLEIDLGTVKNLAEVVINGKSTGVLWKPPFRVDITDLLRRGSNSLSIRVTNLWPNRLIGDRQPGARPVAFTTFNPYTADSPLLDSGLLGPVAITRVAERRLEAAVKGRCCQ